MASPEEGSGSGAPDDSGNESTSEKAMKQKPSYLEDDLAVEDLQVSELTVEKVNACKYFIQTYYDNLHQSIKEKMDRRKELELAMAQSDLSDSEQNQLRQVYRQKEIEFLRLKRKRMSVNDFQTLKVIGRGSFGEVRLVKDKQSKEIFALKKMRKSEMVAQNQIGNVRAERDLMARTCDNMWLVSLYYAFQDKEYLYLVMEYYPGGDLWNLLQTVQLTEDEVRFYLAEIIMAVASIHKLGFFHRDLKPENILFDREGHVKLADFGLCKPTNQLNMPLLDKLLKKDKKELQKQIDDAHAKTSTTAYKVETWKKKRKELAFSVVGTPGYAAPEVMYETGYGNECDWWSLGIMMYEMVFGFHPFHADSIEELCVNVLQWKQTLKFPKDIPVSPETLDLMQRLICDAPNRLGRKNVNEIKSHPFFEGVEWDELQDIEPPFVPDVKSLQDTSYFEEFPESQSEDEGREIGPRFKMGGVHQAFVGFTFKRFDAVMDKGARISDDQQPT